MQIFFLTVNKGKLKEMKLSAGMTNLTEGLKVNEKERDASMDFEEIKTMTDCNARIKKKVKSKVAERDQWSDPFDFIVSMIAYAVGLGKSDVEMRNIF